MYYEIVCLYSYVSILRYVHPYYRLTGTPDENF